MKDGNLWNTDEKVVSQKNILEMYLHPNGLYGSIKCVKGGVVYYEIDTTKTNLGDFYTWGEVLEKGGVPDTLDIWRPFFYMEDINKEDGNEIGNFWEDVGAGKL